MTAPQAALKTFSGVFISSYAAPSLHVTAQPLLICAQPDYCFPDIRDKLASVLINRLQHNDTLTSPSELWWFVRTELVDESYKVQKKELHVT